MSVRNGAKKRSKQIDDTLERLRITKEDKLKSVDDYTFSPNYTATTSITQRITRIWKLNVNTMHELRVDNGLKDESSILFFATLTMISILQIILISLNPKFVVLNTTSFVTIILSSTFVTGYSFIFIMNFFMNLLVKVDQALTREEMYRIMAYPFTLTLVSIIFSLLSVITGFGWLSLFGFLFYIYSFVVLIVTLRSVYKTNNLYASFGVIVSFTIARYVVPLIPFSILQLFLGQPY